MMRWYLPVSDGARARRYLASFSSLDSSSFPFSATLFQSTLRHYRQPTKNSDGQNELLMASSDFLEKLVRTASDGHLADFTICCGGEEFKVHKIILSLHSGYFERLFKSEFKVRYNPNEGVHCD